MADPTQAQTYLAVLDDGHRIERIVGCCARAASGHAAAAPPSSAMNSRRLLIRYLIGAGEQRRRHRQTERLCGPEIDNEFDFRDLLYRQISRFLAV
jgi:hypothetical protein